MANFLALPLTSFLHTHAQSFSSCARRKRPRPEEEDDMDRTPLERAVNAVKNGTMGLRLAAKTYGIQQNKLFRVLHGVQKMNSQMGRPTAMPKEVEDILAQKLRELIKNHFYLELVNLLSWRRIFVRSWASRPRDGSRGVSGSATFLSPKKEAPCGGSPGDLWPPKS